MKFKGNFSFFLRSWYDKQKNESYIKINIVYIIEHLSYLQISIDKKNWKREKKIAFQTQQPVDKSKCLLCPSVTLSNAQQAIAKNL